MYPMINHSLLLHNKVNNGKFKINNIYSAVSITALINI